MTESRRKEYADIPGTTVFDGRLARKGYHLNMFCMSLMSADNRAAFKADEKRYMARWPLSPEQVDAVSRRDWNGLLGLGLNIFFMLKLSFTDGLSVQQLAGQMTGMTPQQYVDMMLAGGRPIEGNRSVSEWKGK
jgi:protocatechuate 4,5-dioxygenase alpha chain